MSINLRQLFLVAISVLGFFSHASHADVCWKSTYGRGVGSVPGSCNPQETKSGLLCYPHCKPGFQNVAGVCWKTCPPRFKDTGGHCLKPGSYGRGGGYALWSEGNCKRDHKQGCERWGLLYYPKCAESFHAAGCCVCSPNCPRGTKDIGVSCQKDSYVVRPITPNCGTRTYDAGLCYDRCANGYNGIGPVCWGQCPKDKPVDCGAMCGTSAADCASSIGEMVMSVGQVVAKIAETVTTLGASTGFDAAANAAKNSIISTIKSTLKKVATTTAKLGAGALTQELQRKGLPADMAQKLSSMTTNPDTFDYEGFLKGLDPTGIVKVVDAFNKQICPTP